MEEAAELGNYLPLSFKTRNEQDYIAFVWNAFETNYTHGKTSSPSEFESEERYATDWVYGKIEKRGFENDIMGKWICRVSGLLERGGSANRP